MNIYIKFHDSSRDRTKQMKEGRLKLRKKVVDVKSISIISSSVFEHLSGFEELE